MPCPRANSKLPIVIIEDGLASNSPQIKEPRTKIINFTWFNDFEEDDDKSESKVTTNVVKVICINAFIFFISYFKYQLESIAKLGRIITRIFSR